MGSNENIYAAPETLPENTRAEITGRGENLFVDSKYVWVNKNSVLPNICMITGEVLASGSRRTKVKLYYTNPLCYLVIPLIFLPAGLLIVLIVLLVCQKKLMLELQLADKMVRRRKTLRSISIGLLLCSISLFFFAAAKTIESLFLVGTIAIVAAIIVGAISRYRIRCGGYDGANFKLKGVHHNFVEFVATGRLP